MDKQSVLHRLLRTYDQRLEAVESCHGVTHFQRFMMGEEIIRSTLEALDGVPEETLHDAFDWFVVYSEDGAVEEYHDRRAPIPTWEN